MLNLINIGVDDFTDWPYYIDVLIRLLIALGQAVLLFFITKVVLDKATKNAKSIGDGLYKKGIEKVDCSTGMLSKHDIKVLFGKGNYEKPFSLRLVFVSGVNFLFNYREEIEELVKNGTKVEIYIGNPKDCKLYEELNKAIVNSEYRIDDKAKKLIISRYKPLYDNKCDFRDLSFLERNYLMISASELSKYSSGKYQHLSENDKEEAWSKRISKFGDATCEGLLVTRLVEEINSRNENKIVLKYYVDEYQGSIILAEYGDSNSKLWTNLNSPIMETKDSINVFAQRRNSSKGTYIDDIENYLDYLQDKYS